jgi:PAS domain S-box-containing protein
MNTAVGTGTPEPAPGDQATAFDPPRLLSDLLGRREEIAAHWQRALAGTGFVPFGAGELHERLLALTERLIQQLLAEATDQEAARAVGANLVQLHYGQPASLGRTQQALAEHLTAGLPAADVLALQPRLAALLGAFAAGFFEEARRAILDEQEAIRGALLRERKRTGEALRESEGRFRAIFEGSPIGIVVAGLDGRIVETNPALQQMLGYRGDEMHGQAFTAYATPEDLPATWALHRELMLGQRDQYEVDQGFQRKGGGTVLGHVTATLLRDAEGQPWYVLAMGEDITERTLAAKTVAQQYRAADLARSQTRAILDATSEAMLLIAADGRVLTANRRVSELFPIAGTLQDRPFAELQGEFARILGEAGAAELAAQIPDSERRFTQDLVQLWPERRDLELYSTLVPDERGQPLGRLFAFRDVTRERAVDRMKSEFVSLVSHELRTPLTSIKGYVDLLLAGDVGDLTVEQQEFLTIVQRNADREVTLVNDLLDLSRLEAGELDLPVASVALAPLLRHVVASLLPSCNARRQQVTLEASAELPPVLGNADRLMQIFMNLVSNAHKYTPDGGQITISASVTERTVQVAVTDTGIGLSEQEQAQLFTKFFRAKHPVAQEAGGTGLGLVITRMLVERQGGELQVESSPNHGSTFSVRLPRADRSVHR